MASKFGDIQIRAPRKIAIGQVIPIKARIIHPMESGLRKDKVTQKVIPAHFINSVKIYYGNKLLTDFDWSYAVSKDPFVTFNLRADKAAPLRIVWKDNKGGGNEKSIEIKPQ